MRLLAPPQSCSNCARFTTPCRAKRNSKMRSPAKLATFLYHDVADTPAESGFQRPSALPYKQTRKNFVSHLEGIANSGFSPRSVPEVDFRKAEKQVLITFDDGGRGAL